MRIIIVKTHKQQKPTKIESVFFFFLISTHIFVWSSLLSTRILPSAVVLHDDVWTIQQKATAAGLCASSQPAAAEKVLPLLRLHRIRKTETNIIITTYTLTYIYKLTYPVWTGPFCHPHKKHSARVWFLYVLFFLHTNIHHQFRELCVIFIQWKLTTINNLHNDVCPQFDVSVNLKRKT